MWRNRIQQNVTLTSYQYVDLLTWCYWKQVDRGQRKYLLLPPPRIAARRCSYNELSFIDQVKSVLFPSAPTFTRRICAISVARLDKLRHNCAISTKNRAKFCHVRCYRSIEEYPGITCRGGARCTAYSTSRRCAQDGATVDKSADRGRSDNRCR